MKNLLILLALLIASENAFGKEFLVYKCYRNDTAKETIGIKVSAPFSKIVEIIQAHEELFECRCILSHFEDEKGNKV